MSLGDPPDARASWANEFLVPYGSSCNRFDLE